MAIRAWFSITRTLNHHFFHSLSSPKTHHSRLFSSQTILQDPNSLSSSQYINEISRILSDFRDPHHDLERPLTAFSQKITPGLVEQVLKRCKNLGFSAHRFFLWAKRLPGFEHSKESYHILVDILGSSKQFPLIWDFLSDMRETQCCEIRPEIFWLIFRAYCRANLPGDAIRAFHQMGDFGVKAGVGDVDQLLYVLCKRKHVKQAQEFFDKVNVEVMPNAKTYSILMRGWGDVGDSSEARKLFEEMRERGCAVDVVAYNSLLEALCKGGNVDEAYKLFREMGSNGLAPDACSYSIFIRAYCEVNDIHSAFQVLDRMRRYNLVPNVFTYNCIVKKLCKSEKVDEAYQLLDEMIERGVSPDLWSYNAIQAFHCDHCEVNKALRLISRMEKENCMPDRHTYNMVLKMLLRVGRFDRVTDVWGGMEERGFYPAASTYAVMVHGFCKKKGKLEEACKYFEMMIDDGIPPYSCTVELLRNRVIGLGFSEQIDVLAGKMERSTSCVIQELSSVMRGEKASGRLRSEEQNLPSEERGEGYEYTWLTEGSSLSR